MSLNSRTVQKACSELLLFLGCQSNNLYLHVETSKWNFYGKTYVEIVESINVYDHLVLGSILVKVTLSLDNAVCPMPIDTISISRSNECMNWCIDFP